MYFFFFWVLCFRVSGLCFRVLGLCFRVLNFGFRVTGLCFRVGGLGPKFRVWGSGGGSHKPQERNDLRLV